MKDPAFLAFYKVKVLPFVESSLVKHWKKFGGHWIAELTGGSCEEYMGLNMDEFCDFTSMSGEEQYAFMMWLKRNHPKVTIS